MLDSGHQNSALPLPVILFYTTALSFLSGVLWATLVPVSLATTCWLMLMALVCALLCRHNQVNEARRWWLIICFIFIFLAIGTGRVTSVVDNFGTSKLANELGKTIILEGVVVHEPDIRLTTQQLYLKTATDKVLVSTDRYLPVAYGDRVQVEGVLREPEAFVTDLGRTFAYPDYLLAKGVEYQISFAKVTVKSNEAGNWLIEKLLLMKQALLSQIEKHLPEPTAGLGEGLLLGVKQALGEDLETAFRQTGIIHIVVLSGYNIMLVVTLVMYVLSYLLPLRPRIFTSLVAITFFALMVGLSATVVRASIMASLLLLAQAYSRSYLLLRGLLVAGVLMVVVNPLLLVYDIGFQLSFMATLGLILVAPVLEYWLKMPKWFKPMGTYFYATVATQIVVLPLLLYYMGEFSVVAVVVNMLVLPMVPVAMLLTFILTLVGFFSSSLASILAFPTYFSLVYIIELARWFAGLPFASVVVPTFPFWAVQLAYVVIGFGLWRVLRLMVVRKENDLGESLLRQTSETKSVLELEMADWVIEEESESGIIKVDNKVGVALRATPTTTRADVPKDTPSFFR